MFIMLISRLLGDDDMKAGNKIVFRSPGVNVCFCFVCLFRIQLIVYQQLFAKLSPQTSIVAVARRN